MDCIWIFAYNYYTAFKSQIQIMVVANLCFISVLNIFYTLSWPQDKAKLHCCSVAHARAQDLTEQCSCSSRLEQGVWELCLSEHVPSRPQGQAKMRWPMCPHLPASMSPPLLPALELSLYLYKNSSQRCMCSSGVSSYSTKLTNI